MGRTQEPGGDYEYDEAHQDVQAEAHRQAAQPGEMPAPPRSGQDAGGDYAYDEAHDF